MRLDDSIDPAASRAVANVRLLFVASFYFCAKFLELFVCGLLVTAFPSSSQNAKYGVRCLSGAHHCITRSWPGHNKSRVIRLSAHGVIPRTKGSPYNDRDLRHCGIADRVHQLCTTANDPALFRVAHDHKPGDILEKYDGHTALITIDDKTRSSVGTLGINNAAHLNLLLLRPHLHTL